jgi:hypothetical protein
MSNRQILSTLIVGIPGVAVGIAAIAIPERRQSQAAIPRLTTVSVKPANGEVLLTVKNESHVTSAPIGEFKFVVIDPQALRRIETVYPKPENNEPRYTGSVETDIVEFEGGWWAGDRFEFHSDTNYYVKSGEPTGFLLRLIDRKLAGMAVNGSVELTVWYDDEPLPYNRNGIPLVAKRPPDDPESMD